MKTYLWTLKCVKCTLECVVLSMFKDWYPRITARDGGPFCPECGSTATGPIGEVHETDIPTSSIPRAMARQDVTE